MTNNEKIIMEAIKNGVYSSSEVKKFLSAGEALPIHTSYEWRQLGYHIKKGEHARITTKLWKMVPEADGKNGDEEKGPQFYLADTFLFTKEQVEQDQETRQEARLEVMP